MKTIKAFETSLLALPEIKTSHSFFRVLETIHAGLMGSGGADLYRSPLIFQQVYHRALSHPDSRRLFEGSLDFDSRCFCIALWEADGVPTDFELLLAQIETLAAETLGAIGNVWITGSTTLAHSQSKRLIAAQFQSLAMALLLITILLMLQFRSWQLGLLSLIPNFFPLAALFGTMGWFGIPLDNMTIMVAVVSFGLSVDDTVHYFTHLRNGLGKAPRMKTIPHALTHAYRMSAKALLSTSAVIVLSLMTLVMSPFKPAASFGLLASVAAAAALASDVLLVPALILWSGRIQRLIVTGFTSPPEAKEHP